MHRPAFTVPAVGATGSIGPPVVAEPPRVRADFREVAARSAATNT